MKRKETPTKASSTTKKGRKSIEPAEKLSYAEQKRRAREWAEEERRKAAEAEKAEDVEEKEEEVVRMPKSGRKSISKAAASRVRASTAGKADESPKFLSPPAEKKSSAKIQSSVNSSIKSTTKVLSRSSSKKNVKRTPDSDSEQEDDDEEEKEAKPVQKRLSLKSKTKKAVASDSLSEKKKTPNKQQTPRVKKEPVAKLFASEPLLGEPVEVKLDSQDLAPSASRIGGSRVLQGAEAAEAFGLNVAKVILVLILATVTYVDLQMGVTALLVIIILSVLRRAIMMLFASRKQYSRGEAEAAATVGDIHDYYANSRKAGKAH